MSGKFLIVGGTGKIGEELLKLFEPNASNIKVLLRSADKQQLYRNKGIETVIANLNDKEKLDVALENVSKVFLLTSPGPEQIELQKNMIDAAKRMGVKFLTRVSAMGIDPAPNNPLASANLAKWHLELENYLTDSGIPFCHLRPNFFMQNMLAFKASILQEGKFYGALHKAAAISLVHVADIAKVAYEVLNHSQQHSGKSYNITGPEALTFSEIADQISIAINKPVEYCYIEPSQLKKKLVEQGTPEWFIHDKLCFFEGYSQGYGSKVERTVKDLTHSQPIRFQDFAYNFQGHSK